MKLLKQFIILAVLILAMAGCSTKTNETKKEETTEAKELKEVTVMLDWYPNAVHSFLYTAIEKGYFEEEGVKVNIQTPANPTDPLTLAATGKVTVGFYYQPDVVIARANEDIPVKSIGAVVRSPLNHIVFLKSAGITSPKDLEGKTVGFPGTPLSEEYLKTMVKEDGGDPSKVKIIDIGWDIVPALVTKKTDAVTGAYINHEVPVLRHEGQDPAYLNPADYGVPNYYELVMVAGEKTIAEDRETLEAFLSGAKKGYEFMKQNPDEALQILLNNQDKESFPLIKEVEKESMEILLSKMEENGEEFLSQTAKSWEEQSNWLKEKGIANKTVKPEELFETILK